MRDFMIHLCILSSFGCQSDLREFDEGKNLLSLFVSDDLPDGGAPLAKTIMHLLHIRALRGLRDSPRRTSKKQPLGIMRKGSARVGYAVICTSHLAQLSKSAAFNTTAGKPRARDLRRTHLTSTTRARTFYAQDPSLQLRRKNFYKRRAAGT
eukprot:scaffold56325_cov32-Prasinocladus_malaysianus.AAC.2